MRRGVSTTARVAASILVALVLGLSGSAPAAAIEPPPPPVLFPDDPVLQEAYADGFTTGYSVGADDGFADGRRRAGAQADLRDDVADEAEQEPVDEGGEDLGDEITPSPSPTPAPGSTGSPDQTTSPAVVDDTPDQSGGVPWWPLAFATAATAWFVTRRRRLDAADDDG